jgi:hypothetical protein
MSENRQSRAAPTIEPGQIWLIEQLSATDLSPMDRNAVIRANVVLYDRALEPLVAEILPLGSYAEPLPRDHRAGGSAITPRALQFAADGWSVVQLVEALPGQRAAAGLNRLQRPGIPAIQVPAIQVPAIQVPAIQVPAIQVPAIQVIARTPVRDATLPERPVLIDEFADDEALTQVFGSLGVRAPAPAQTFTANGLAG